MFAIEYDRVRNKTEQFTVNNRLLRNCSKYNLISAWTFSIEFHNPTFSLCLSLSLPFEWSSKFQTNEVNCNVASSPRLPSPPLSHAAQTFLLGNWIESRRTKQQKNRRELFSPFRRLIRFSCAQCNVLLMFWWIEEVRRCIRLRNRFFVHKVTNRFNESTATGQLHYYTISLKLWRCHSLGALHCICAYAGAHMHIV